MALQMLSGPEPEILALRDDAVSLTDRLQYIEAQAMRLKMNGPALVSWTGWFDDLRERAQNAAVKGVALARRLVAGEVVSVPSVQEIREVYGYIGRSLMDRVASVRTVIQDHLLKATGQAAVALKDVAKVLDSALEAVRDGAIQLLRKASQWFGNLPLPQVARGLGIFGWLVVAWLFREPISALISGSATIISSRQK